MFHLVDNLQDKAGNALAGYYVKLKVPGGAYATLYADTSSTPIVSVSGVANAAVTDENGQYRIYVADGDYEVEFFDKNDINTRIRTIPSTPMYARGPVGPTGATGATGPAGTVTANSGVGTTWTTETAQTSAYSNTHNLAKPTVAFTNSAGGDDGVNARWLVNVGKFTNGPTGHATYFDTVAAWGLNLTNSYTPANTSIAAASYRIESKFAQGGASDPFAVEFHTSINSADASSVECRPISVFAPHLKADWARSLGVTLRAGQISFMDGSISPDVSGTERVKFDLRPGQNTINLGKNGSERAPGFSMNSNGVYFARQINAAGNAFISLPFANADDMTEISAATKVVSAAKADSTFAITAFHVGQCTSLAANGYLDFVVSQSATTGATIPFLRQVNCSGTGSSKIENLGAGALTFDLASAGAGTGFLVNGTKVVGARSTGWTVMTGTGSKAALAAAAAGTASASYVQAELQGALNRIAALEARLKSYDDALVAHGLIGA